MTLVKYGTMMQKSTTANRHPAFDHLAGALLREHADEEPHKRDDEERPEQRERRKDHKRRVAHPLGHVSPPAPGCRPLATRRSPARPRRYGGCRYSGRRR